MKSLSAARSLSDTLEKRVLVPLNMDDFLKPEGKLKYHTPVEPTSDIFKLEADFSAGIECHELITGPLPYKEARVILIKVFNWIKKNGWTTDRCSVHANISFDDNKIKLNTELHHLNVLKFCLDFDEDMIYKKFPNRIHSIYANSIKNLLTNNIFNTDLAGKQISVPNEKYYGVNFQKIVQDYIEFRYLGSKDYEQHTSLYLEMVDYFITFTYKQLQEPFLTTKDNEKLKDIIEAHKKILEVYRDPRLLQKNFPKLQVMVDMNNNIEVLKTYWGTIKDLVLEILLKGGTKKGILNYDTDFSKMQVKNAEFDFCNITDFELLDCKGYGYVTNCKLFDCNFENMTVTSCWLYDGNYIKESRLLNCCVNETNVIENCYIKNDSPEFFFNGTMKSGIWRQGTIGTNAKIESDVSVVDSKKQEDKPKPKRFGTYAPPEGSQFKERKFLIATKK